MIESPAWLEWYSATALLASDLLDRESHDQKSTIIELEL